MLGTSPANMLTDSFQRQHSYLRISLTDRCNLRCAYCMPERGIDWTPSAQLLTNDEVVRLARIFTSLGIRKIRLTGGEPMLRQQLEPLVAQIAALPGLGLLAMTTNGLLLADRAEGLRAAGLNSLTISLDTLRPDRFQSIAKRDRFGDAMRGIEAALAAGFAPLKINVVIMRGVNEDELTDFVAWAHDRLIELRFIEYMPFPETDWHSAGVMSYRDMMHSIAKHYELIPLVQERGAVGKAYAVKGSRASVSFVSSMTDSFCASCTRLRLTADGQIKSCLFHPAERNLRDALRKGASDDELAAVIHAAVLAKPQAHPPMEELLHMDNRSMVAIGG